VRWDDLSPEQQRQIEAEQVDLQRQLLRTGVDLSAAFGDLIRVEEPRREDRPSDDADDDLVSYTVHIDHAVDFSGIVATLRRLPDGAGTSAFVTAYNATHKNWRDRPPNER
jgi:hypothetical protein